MIVFEIIENLISVHWQVRRVSRFKNDLRIAALYYFFLPKSGDCEHNQPEPECAKPKYPFHGRPPLYRHVNGQSDGLPSIGYGRLGGVVSLTLAKNTPEECA